MRKGQNPAKFVTTVSKPERVTAAVLTYVPFLSGYFADALDVLRACLDSMRADPGAAFDTLVFDNGSCEEVRNYLLDEQAAGGIQFLVLSDRNVGKGGAWNTIIGGAPGEIIAYCDSDVLFSPNWLRRSVEVLEAFPDVGMVTARPFRTPPEFYSATLDWGRKHASVLNGQLIPWQTFLEFNLSLGQTEEDNKRVYAETSDWKVSHAGLDAIAGASHWQFTGWKRTLQRFLPFDMDKPMGQVRELDRRVNDEGLLRLMLPEPFAMNLSNSMTYLGGDVPKLARHAAPTLPKRILNLAPVRKVLLALYNRIFRWYYA
jgi:glycosyltransferase involved in cell wall biosynthesis